MNPAPRFYKPVAIRSPFLALFCAITLTVFVLLQLVPASDQSPTACEGCASSPPNSSPSAPPPSNFTVFTSFTSASYFLGAYFPTLVGVLYSMLWEVAHMQMMQMEPFFQLATRGGADASSSLLLNYASASLPVVLFKSIKKAHGAVVWSSVVALVISICVPLASETLYISTSGTCSSTEDGSDCEPSLASRPALARVEQALVGVIFLIVAYLAVWYRRRQSGIYAEATSIVGVATLLHDPHRLGRPSAHITARICLGNREDIGEQKIRAWLFVWARPVFRIWVDYIGRRTYWSSRKGDRQAPSRPL